VNLLVFQMSQEEEVLELEDTLLLEDSDSEMFQTAEGVSSTDEADEACLSEEEGERPAGVEDPGQREEERPGGANAPGSKKETEPPGPRAWRKKNKGRGRYGAGRGERRRRQALYHAEATRPAGDKGPGSPAPKPLYLLGKPEGNQSREASVTTGNSSDQGCPMVGCGRWVTDLRGHCLQDHIPEVFQDLSRMGRVLGGSGGLHCRRS